MPVLVAHSPVKVCLCSILQWAAEACYQDSSGFLYFLQHGCGSYATFCFSVAAEVACLRTQYAFLATALGLLRSGRSAVIVALIMEGPGGLWWEPS